MTATAWNRMNRIEQDDGDGIHDSIHRPRTRSVLPGACATVRHCGAWPARSCFKTSINGIGRLEACPTIGFEMAG